jgi:undecaprenyl-phosphate 4-deoxy-4-formamido-L-arabinose transferase
MLMLMLGIIGEYVGRIYICINKSPQYVIKDVTSNAADDVDE